MNRNVPTQTSGPLYVRLASLAAAGTFTAVILATLVGAMPPLDTREAFANATVVTIEPARIEVTGQRATTTVGTAADPHVG